MQVLRDIRTIYQLAKPKKGKSHAERMQSFYKNQAEDYDDFRKKLLPPRKPLFQCLEKLNPSGVWVDMGAGTGLNLEELNLDYFKEIYLVDLADSLLSQAQNRAKKFPNSNIAFVEQDASTFRLAKKVDLITFSYSLTMIPDWFSALDNAYKLLNPGGYIAVIDFHIPRAEEQSMDKVDSIFANHLWPLWFSWDDVMLSRDHVPYLQKRFETLNYQTSVHRLPYLPLSRVPYYHFVGRKKVKSKT